MQHHNKNRKFGRVRKVRTGLMRSLAHNLIEHGAITTTEAKAKSLRPFVEKLVTHAKEDTVAKRRHVSRALGNDEVATHRLFTVIAPQYVERSGGYIRIVRIAVRQGDSATVARIMFV